MEAGLPANRLMRPRTPRPATGIVHLGLGAFFRAFGCVYVADAMQAAGGDWGIVGVSLRSPDTRDALKPQDWAYTSVTLTPDGPQTRVIDVLNDVLVAPEDPQAVLDAMCDPGVRIVSLTVTEKGYCHNPATGALNMGHPDILYDLTHNLPRSAPGYLVRALQQRHAAGIAPFTVLTCDNLPHNGALVRGVVLDMARRIDPALADWIAENGRFPATMVDRITPATTDEDIKTVEQLTGFHDAAPVMHEPFRQWAVQDDFVNGDRPDLAAAGAQLVDDVAAFEDMKLRMLNGTHSALAYLGYLAGHETISDTVADPAFAAYVRHCWEEIMPAVAAPPGVDLTDYADALFDRYANPAIRHRTWQIAMDGSQKLPQRLLGTLRANLDAGRDSPALCLAVAGWMRYVAGKDEAGQPIDVRDPLADLLRDTATDSATGTVAALLSLDQIFPADLAAQLAAPVSLAAATLWAKGASSAVQEVTQ
ncbi:mannitol dehydrogenase family protein [Loktanella salsilacus]|uniref:mannitol dehydrogenase family protein n=1 Tax=Loktanella salsilacus TaxID=195913 RepID=UPI0020B65ED4|nr:mannitol dehydrogenase family protein [Loktanella salsilacus]UTH47836.1 mannitol dehydrogenase family protein [Loktanella salsilacus]